ncbi:MAG: dinitrogenase iron-molybdenum cofactor biosynthesis protein [Candidatus Cellulosilyticum pullistercoris]|uniref:Dinitrogenase iron-molybdenum cofactor biosynthesis protein n=1 Tax=Candidatus Cellulosilyticum pullistercoris TaxID=2838521 RepID=A0A9E2NMR6_9FIRM|nr:dinitrogenase iron-molybdenum cofactor biosynthesis protein [Candidatus Cellulosilyticum pullistercoris]
MKLAVTFKEEQIFQHFGHTEQFKIYEIENQKVVKSQIISTNGSGHGALATFLKDQGVDTLICGGIGGGAKAALTQAGIKLYGGVSGLADEQVQAFLQGTLKYNPEVTCSHHDNHGDSHNCESHEHHTCGHTCGE